MTSSVAAGVYRGMEWITRLTLVNLLWILFTCVGLIVFGIGPATAAMYAVTRKWVQGQTDLPVIRTFLSAYKKEFLNANLVGLLMFAIGYFLIVDYRFFHDHFILRIGTLLLLTGYAVIWVYVWPVFVHYAAKPVKILKLSLIIGFTRPFRSLLMIVVLASVLVIMMHFPKLIPFFGGSLISYVLTLMAHQAFPKAEQSE